MWSFGAFCDEFCVHTRLFLKLDLVPSRESALHFFERMRHAYPRMTRLRRRDEGSMVLDEEADGSESRRSLRVDTGALRFSCYAPPSALAVSQYAETVLEQAPAHLSLSDLDYDYLEVVFAFDLEYRGNHDQLVAETLLPEHPLVAALGGDERQVIDCQPFVGVSLNRGCDEQLHLEIKGRTTTYELRTGEYDGSSLSVYLTARKYWNASSGNLIQVHRRLLNSAEQVAADRVVPLVIRPLAAAIASQP